MICNYINLEEKVKHGSIFFPFVIYPTRRCACSSGVPVHWHKEFEIGLVTSGEGNYHINQEEYHIKEGDIVLIPPKTLHGMETITGENNLQSDILVFDLNLLIANTSDVSTVKYFMPLLQGKCTCKYIFRDNVLAKMIKDSRQIFTEKKDGYELLIKGNLFFMFQRLFELDVLHLEERIQKVPLVYEAMLEAIKYIGLHYKEKISLDEIAKETGKSKYYITRNFHKYTGMPCIEYVNHYRLTVASTMLIETNRLIIDIALDVGFENISYFNKLFRKKFNLTPKEYRKEMLCI